MYRQIRPLLYLLDPEQVHEMAIGLAKVISHSNLLLQLTYQFFKLEDPRLKTQVGSLEFPNPIGLAAGFDKNGVSVPSLLSLGFGSVEIGTLTPRPQTGNQKPRLFRLVKDQGIINRMGFNNLGVEAFQQQIQGQQQTHPLGVNLGKNKTTDNAQAGEDYCIGLEQTYDVGDYFTINLSSPNTPGLRDLQAESALLPLLKKILALRETLAARTGKKKPIWLKVAPDLSTKELTVICQIALQLGVDALVLTNTSLHRDGLHSPHSVQTGGLSGKPIQDLSNQMLSTAFELTGGKIPLIGVGGIFNAQDVWNKLERGATFVQLYTGLIYQGPGIVKSIKKGLIKQIEQNPTHRLPKRVV